MIVYIENRGRAVFHRNGRVSRYTMTVDSSARLWDVCREAWQSGRAEARLLTGQTAFIFKEQR